MQRAAVLSVQLWGAEKQLNMLEEEALELALALVHLRRERFSIDKVLEEVADVKIMLAQFELMVGEYRLERCLRQKLLRHERRILETLQKRRVVLIQCPQCDSPMTHEIGEVIDCERDESYYWNHWKCTGALCRLTVEAE